MKEVIQLMTENPLGALATVDSGKPQVRPWGFAFADEGRLYFCTANTKDVYRQLQQNPWAAFTCTSPQMVTARVSGPITFTSDLSLKQRVIDSSETVRRVYHTADNPVLEVFFIEHGQASIADFSGQPPRKYTF